MSLRFGLDESTIQKITSVFVACPQVQEVILYGSRAKGNFKNGSDIDLTMVGEGLTFDILKKLMNEIDGLDLPYTVDLSILSNITDADVVEHIKRVGVTFYEAGAKQASGGI